MSLDERLDVPPAKSPRSTSAVFRPRDTASRAMPAPVMPPPMTRTSKRSRLSRSRFAARSTLRWYHESMLTLAHRARQGTRHPENSLAALRAVLRGRIDGVEIDVRRSADGGYFIHH